MFLMLLVASLCLLLPSTGWGAEDVATPPESAAYLLVIDHSGSMTKPLPSGKTRWVEMQEKAVEFLRNAPLESRIWIAVFSGEAPQPYLAPFSSEENRAAAISRVQSSYGPPSGGTALYDTLGLAFEEAERLSRQYPNRNISVLAYTDGIDESSKKWNPQSLSLRFGQIVRDNQNLFLFYTRIGNEGLPIDKIIISDRAREGAFKIPLPVSLVQSAIGLKSPLIEPKQTIELEFLASDANWKLLEGTKLSFQFVADKQNLSVQVTDAAFRRGRIPITLEVANPKQLQVDQDYGGRLKITYPTLGRYEVQGRDQVQVTFQRGEKVQIYDIRPADGTAFAAGKPVFFWVKTLQGAKVLWDFGDGTSASGMEIQHVYNTPGDRTVTVSAEADPRVGPTRKTLTVKIIDLGVSIDPVTGTPVEGTPLKFTATGRGQMERFEWVIDGQTFAGEKRSDGKSGTEIAYAFRSPARHVLSVVGYAEKAVVQSEERVLTVIEKPDVQIVSPQTGQSLHFGIKSRFTAQVRGPVQNVRWTISRKGDVGKPLAEAARPVVATESSRTSEWEFAFPEADMPFDAEVVAEARLSSEISLKSPSTAVSFRVEYPRLTPKIEIEGTQPLPYGKPVQFYLRGEGIRTVAWNFGDGTNDATNNQSPAHEYHRTGPFHVTADVVGRGGRTATAGFDINITARKPQAHPKVLVAGREIGSEVRVNNTIELRDESDGDIVRREWYYDGKLLSPGQATVPLDDVGEHRLLERVIGPPGPTGETSTDEAELLFRVRSRPRYELLGVAIAVALLMGGIAAYLLTGNHPQNWKLFYSPGTDAFDEFSPRKKIAEYWDRWRKRARIPLRKLFPESAYWGTGEGAREDLTIYGTGAVEFTGVDEMVTQLRSGEGTETLVDYAWFVRKCNEPDYQRIFFRLEKVRNDSVWHLILLVLIGVLLIASVGLVWRQL